MPGKRALTSSRDPGDDYPRDNGDLETGAKKRRFPRFKDAVELAMAERTTGVLKAQLKAGVDRDEFEQYRKSDDEVGSNLSLHGRELPRSAGELAFGKERATESFSYKVQVG